MRNLYSKLNISPLSSHEEIESAVKYCTNASVKADAMAILLNPDRRQIYDQVNTAMIDIGNLRARLGLSHAPNWTGIVASEYTQQSKSCSSRYDELIAKIKAANRQLEKEENAKSVRDFVFSWIRIAIGVAFIVGFIWLAMVLTDESSTRKPSRIPPSPIQTNDIPVSSSVSPDTYTSSAPKRPNMQQIRKAQKLLTDLGYEPGPVDGQYGRRTARAVKEFQNDINIKQDGLIDQDLINILIKEAKGRPFSEPVHQMPYSGSTRYQTNKTPIAPLKIRTSRGGNYYVKLEDNITQRNIMDIFIHGGDEVEVEVPLGSYIFKYASGDTWYGYKYYFGPKTSYNKADKVFNFQRIGNQITGYTVTLYRVAHGNLSTSRISSENF